MYSIYLKVFKSMCIYSLFFTIFVYKINLGLWKIKNLRGLMTA